MVCGGGVVFGCRTKMTLMSTMCGQFQAGSTRSGHKLNSRLLAFYKPRSLKKSVASVPITAQMTGPCISVVHEKKPVQGKD